MTRRRPLNLRFALVIVLTITACSDSRPQEIEAEGPETPVATTPSTAASPSPSPSPVPTPAPVVAVDWFNVDDNAVVVRFVAAITNPGPQTLHGLTTEWVAYDDDGTIVGAHSGARPRIGAGETFLYVGGAGGANLTGAPARVEVNITDPGRFVPGNPQRLDVSAITLEENTFGGDLAYDVTAAVTIGDESIESERLTGSVVLRDESGTIVGADFWSPTSLPATLTAGSTFRAEMSFVPADSDAASADVTMWIE